MDPDPALAPLRVVEGGGDEVDVDTGAASRADAAALVARARIDGAILIRTAEPRAARRAAGVIDAIVAARGPDEDTRPGAG